MLAIPVAKPLDLAPVLVTVVEPLVKVTSGALFIIIPIVYLPPTESPGVKYQSNPKLAPNPIALPDDLNVLVVVPETASVLALVEPKLRFNPKYGETPYKDLK